MQAAAWRVLAGGMSQRHDLCVSAPTGSGKTLAYTLPVLQRCLESRSATLPRALIVVPTRSLADQVRTRSPCNLLADNSDLDLRSPDVEQPLHAAGCVAKLQIQA